MAQRTKEYLKGQFTPTKKPTQEDFHDWMDSYVHKDDVETINTSVVNSAISSYDVALKSQNLDGVIDTLGDVLGVMSGFSDDVDLKGYIDGLGGAPSWSTISGRPNDVRLAWTDQTVNTDNYAPGAPSSVANVPIISIASLGSGELAQISGRYVVKDILISRVSFKTDSTALTGYYADRIRSVVFAVQPRINLS